MKTICKAMALFVAAIPLFGFAYDCVLDGFTCFVNGFEFLCDFEKNTASLRHYNESSTSPTVPQSFLALQNYTDGNGEPRSRVLNITVQNVNEVAFQGSGITSISLPDTLEVIFNSAFASSNLESVRFPKSLWWLGRGAFSGCNRLKDVCIDGGNLHVEILAFSSCSSLEDVVIEDGVAILDDGHEYLGNYYGIFTWCASLKSIDVKSHKITRIPSYFCPQTPVERVSLTAVTEIGEYAFSDCGQLQELSSLSSVGNIEPCAFQGCSSLEGPIDLSSVTNMGWGAFRYCRSLSGRIYLPAVEHVADVFESCSSITVVSLPVAKTIGDYTFRGCERLEEVNMPVVETIGQDAFAYCSSLTNVTIPASVTSIGWNAFLDCRNVSVFAFEGSPPEASSDSFARFDGNCSTGTYTTAHAAAWKAVIGNDGKWNGLVMRRVEPTYTIIYNVTQGEGSVGSQTCEFGGDGVCADDGGTLHWEGHYFMGWALAPGENVAYRAGDTVEEPANSTVVNLYDKWSDVVVRFDANGGEFRRKDGTTTNIFDQYFTYDEVQRLFTDELTPTRPGNQFIGWVRGSPEYSSPEDKDSLFGKRQEWTWHDDVTKETFYAVWTTTATISFYNTTSSGGDKTLVPASLARYLTWSVDDGNTRYRSGESVQVFPGRREFHLYVDNRYRWIVGEWRINSPLYDPDKNAFVKNVSNVFDPMFPGERSISFDVGVCPPSEKCGFVLFRCHPEIRESLQGLIANVPDFDWTKVMFSVGKAYRSGDGSIVESSLGVLSGLKAEEVYSLPAGLYMIKEASYDADTTSGDPYWGPVLESGKSIEVADGLHIEEVRFDLFGGADVVRAVFDPCDGEREESEVWFPNISSGIRVASEVLPKPERNGFKFLGWFTEKEGGIELKSGAVISGDKLHWNIPDDLAGFDHTFTVYAQWTDMKDKWVNDQFPDLVFDLNVDVATIAKMPAANGKLTVAQCYSCGVNPTDPDDDLKITNFEMGTDGKPVITLNHTEDGSGNSFMPRVKTLGKTTLSDAEEWREVPEEGDQTMRFFKVDVEMP